MARSTFQQQDYGQPASGEWQELRGELVALLDQVETQVARTARPEPGYQGLAERMRDLRHQVTAVEPDTRHREALRSVQRAIDKFSERDEAPQLPPNPRDTLESAIQQIRARHFPAPTPAAQPMAPAPAPRFGELADAVGGISDRLERLEGELKVQAKGQTSNVREIAEQVGQLSQVVELLAGAVGETGQVKRLEGHIAGLAKLIADGPRVDVDALNKRLDDVALTVGKLAELQKHYADRSDVSGVTQRLDDVTATVDRLADLQLQFADRANVGGLTQRLDDVSATVGRLADLQVKLAERNDFGGMSSRLDEVSATVDRLAELAERTDVSGMTARLDDVSATIGRLADLQVRFANRVDVPQDGIKDVMKAVEDGLRNIYDRVDAIERTMAMPPAELEHITAELGKVAQAMKSPQPQGLIELIDALNDRISDIEARGPEVGSLKLDMEAMRKSVALALEPRFTAIEQQIETLGDKVDERPADPTIAQLEAQVRQLVARMDQTGEQLTGLAKLYTTPPEAAAPDYEQIAELVATRTSEAIRRGDAARGGLDEAGYDEIEKRVAKLMQAASREQPSEETMALEATIREVNDRLKRLETSLEKPADVPPIPPASAAVAASPPPKPAKVDTRPEARQVDPIAPLIEALSFEDEPPARPLKIDLEDRMPDNPSAEAPLVDAPFGDPDPLEALFRKGAAQARQHHSEAPVDPFAEAQTQPEPVSAELPSLEALESQMKPVFDPGTVERPPQPRSSLDAPQPAMFAAAPAPAVDALPDEDDGHASPSRNTFIEAHRRAARQAAAARGGRAAPPAADSNSLIGRAFARFQATRAAETAAASAAPAPSVAEKPKKAPVARSKAPKADKPAKPAPEQAPRVAAETLVRPAREKSSLFGVFRPKADRQLAGDKDPPSQWKAEPAPSHALPAAPQPSLLALGAEETAPAADDAKRSESFLVRHRQPILLAASVVALAFLTLNLIGQRLKSEDSAPAQQAQDVSDAALAPVPMADQSFDTARPAPRQVLDQLTTASIDGAAQKFVADGGKPAMPQAFVAAARGQVASLSGSVPPLPDTLESPVKVAPPPPSVGPEALLAAAADGDVRAQFEVAAIYTEGRAVPEDLKAAAMWYERAAGQGFAPAQYRLGNLYENGRGVNKDLAQARLWYQQAAEAGNRMAMHNLAALYAGGELGTQQFDAAAKWFEEAASRGMKDSQFNLGMLYARGLGVKQDLEASFKWFSLAANKGDKDAGKARDDVAASLDAATVQKLIAEVAAFRPQQIDFAANFAPIGTWSQDFDPGAPITSTKVIIGVQKALSQLGFDVGTPDGVAGGKTAEAIKAFERATGMSESGQINPRLLAVLGSQPV